MKQKIDKYNGGIRMRKTKLTSIILLALVLLLAACGNQGGNTVNTNNSTNEATGSNNASNADTGATEEVEEVTIKVGASPIPHAEILNSLVPVLKEQGINLEVIEFTDYVLPNKTLYEKELDANFFQHVPYLDQFNADNGYDLVSVAGVHVEPFGVYSNSLTTISEIKDGAKIAIPNDPSNGGRSLILLAQNGLIELDENAGLEVTVSDIKNNPRGFEFVELEAATIPRVLDEVDIAAINTNYALEAGLNPVEDALIIEDKNSPYVNILVTRPDNQKDEAIVKLIEALKSSEVESFINETYKGAVVPAFN